MSVGDRQTGFHRRPANKLPSYIGFCYSKRMVRWVVRLILVAGFSLLLFGLLTTHLFSQSQPQSRTQPQPQIADRNLRRAVLEQLELDPKREPALTGTELERLTVLNARDAGITSLEGIQQARNLRELDLRGNKITDLTPLSGMTQLTWLSLRENEQLIDLAPLSELTNLTYLNLNRNHRIRSIEPLSGMQNLDTLILRSVGVLHQDSEQQVLAEIGHLERLNVRDTGLPSVAVLLPLLRDGAYSEQLDLQENPLRDEHLLAPYTAAIDEYEPPRSPFSGRVRASLGALYGIDDWPGTAGGGGQRLHELQSVSPLYDLDLRIELDYRPRGFMRIYAELETELDTDTLFLETPYVEKLFVDYTINYLHRFRFGVHSMSWGNALLLHDPADLVAEVEDGLALRADLQLTDNQDVTAVMSGRGVYLFDPDTPQYYNPDQPAFPQFAYAARYRAQAGPVSIATAGWYRHTADLPLRTTAALAAEFAAVQTGSEISIYWDREQIDDGHGWIRAHVSWQPDGSDWEMDAEYMYDSTVPDFYGQFAGIALKTPAILGWNPEVIWRHTLWRTSGEIIPRIEREILPNLIASLEIPTIYGDFGGYYRVNSEIPGDRTFAVIGKLAYVLQF